MSNYKTTNRKSSHVLIKKKKKKNKPDLEIFWVVEEQSIQHNNNK